MCHIFTSICLDPPQKKQTQQTPSLICWLKSCYLQTFFFLPGPAQLNTIGIVIYEKDH